MQRGTRIILYSHDTLGRSQRRSRALAAALTEDDPTASALILTGSRLAADIILPERVDHVRLPGIIQRPDGSCAAEALGLDIDEMTALRASLIKTAVAAFDPDLLIVDSEPTGFREELLPTLEALTVERRARIVLGLSDALCNRGMLAAEGARKNVVEATECHYDEIWLYSPHSFNEPTADHHRKPSDAGADNQMGGLIDAKWLVRRMLRSAPAQQSAAE